MSLYVHVFRGEDCLRDGAKATASRNIVTRCSKCLRPLPQHHDLLNLGLCRGCKGLLEPTGVTFPRKCTPAPPVKELCPFSRSISLPHRYHGIYTCCGGISACWGLERALQHPGRPSLLLGTVSQHSASFLELGPNNTYKTELFQHLSSSFTSSTHKAPQCLTWRVPFRTNSTIPYLFQFLAQELHRLPNLSLRVISRKYRSGAGLKWPIIPF